MTVTLYYWFAFVAYSAVVIGIGIRIYRRKRDQDDTSAQFWSANRTLSGWSSGLSISASMMSISWSCVYGVQLFYWYGFGAMWLLILPWLITMGGFYFLVPLFRKHQAFSQPELLEKRFGRRLRPLLAPALAFVFVVWGGAEIYAAGITIAPFLGISVPFCLFLIAIVVAAYSFTGGFEAVVATDRIQFALVAGFITIMAAIGIYAVIENSPLQILLEVYQLAPKASSDVPAIFSPGIALILLTFLAYLPGWLVETDIWIRLQAAQNNHEARKGIVVASTNSIIFVGLMPLIIGLSALALYPPVDGVIPAELNDGSLIFTALMRDHAPVWLSIILGIGLVAAAMSTVDTCCNVVALSISYDLLEPLNKRSGSIIRNPIFPRLISVLAVFLAYFYALFTDSLWDIFYLSSGILTTTVFLPVIAAFRSQSTSGQAIAAAACGFIATLFFYYLESRGYLMSYTPAWIAESQLGYILYGLVFSYAGYFLTGLATKNRR